METSSGRNGTAANSCLPAHQTPHRFRIGGGQVYCEEGDPFQANLGYLNPGSHSIRYKGKGESLTSRPRNLRSDLFAVPLGTSSMDTPLADFAITKALL